RCSSSPPRRLTSPLLFVFFVNAPAPTEIYTLSLHDALPISSLQNAFTDGYSTYAGAKSPLEHFTRAAAKEFADRQISVNEICRRSEEHTSELQSRFDLVCRLLLEKKKHITACVNSSSN